MESSEESTFLISDVSSKNLKNYKISNIIEDESEECELDFSYTNTVSFTDDVISDALSDIGNDSSFMSDKNIGALKFNLVDNEVAVKNTSPLLKINKTIRTFREDHDYCLANSSLTSRTYSERIEDGPILEKIDCKDDNLHNFNNGVKIRKVETFNNYCDNDNNIVYKIQKLKPEKGNIGISKNQSSIFDLLLNIQALNQQALTKISRLEENLEMIKNLMLGTSYSNQLEKKMKNTSKIVLIEDNEDTKRSRIVDDEAINYNDYDKLTNMTPGTEDIENTVEDEELIYQHKESSNVIFRWNKDEENTIENDLLSVEGRNTLNKQEECTQNDKNIGEKNLSLIDDNLMEDGESNYQFEEWLDSPFSGLENDENFENILSITKDEQLNTSEASINQIEFISKPNYVSPPSSLENFKGFSKDEADAAILMKTQAVKLKELSVVLDKNAVANYLKSIKSSQLLKINGTEDDNNEKDQIQLEEELISVFNCALCKSKFANAKLFYNHAKRHTQFEYNCKQHGENDKPNLEKRHGNNKKSFKCDDYNDASHQSSILNWNTPRSSNPYLFECKFCPFVTSYASNLRLHKLKHTKKND